MPKVKVCHTNTDDSRVMTITRLCSKIAKLKIKSCFTKVNKISEKGENADPYLATNFGKNSDAVNSAR